MCFASKTSNFHICDISSIQNDAGKANFFQSSLYISSGMVFSIEVLPNIAVKTVGTDKCLEW